MIREGAATKLVALLSAGAAPATHAALLALRVLSDRCLFTCSCRRCPITSHPTWLSYNCLNRDAPLH